MRVDPPATRDQLEERLRFETFVADTSLRLAFGLRPGEAEAAIDASLRRLLALADADGCVLLGGAHRDRLAWVTCASYAEGVGARLPSGNLASLFPWHVGRLCAGGAPVAVSRLADLPAEAAVDRRSAAALGIQAMLTVFADGESGAHCLMLYRVRNDGGWPDYLARRLRVLAGTFVAALNRDRAEATRGQLEQRHADLLASVRAIIWRADARTFQTTFVSQEAEAILGYPLESWLKIPGFWRDHIHPDDVDRVLATSGVATREGRAHDFEYRMIAADGRTVWLRNIVNVIARDGVPAELAGVTVDITRRRVAEFEAAQLRHQLAHALRVASLGELAATLAHELSQPLGAIVSNAETAGLFLDRPAASAAQLRIIVDEIARDGRRAGAVLQRVSGLLRLEVADPRPIDLRRTIEEVVDLLRAQATTRGIVVAVSAASDLPAIRGDAVQIQQVLLNLLLNAMEAVADRPPNRRRVHIDAQGGGSSVEVSVSDSGPGIPAERLPHVFEPFFTTKPGGLGMGLPICRSIVNSHGGEIRVEANPAGGTVVRVRLPVCAGEGGEA